MRRSRTLAASVVLFAFAAEQSSIAFLFPDSCSQKQRVSLKKHSAFRVLLDNFSGVSESNSFDDDFLLKAYDEWRSKFGKGSFNPERFENFKTNFIAVLKENENENKRAKVTGEPELPPLELNEYGDCSVEEYQTILDNFAGSLSASFEETNATGKDIDIDNDNFFPFPSELSGLTTTDSFQVLHSVEALEVAFDEFQSLSSGAGFLRVRDVYREWCKYHDKPYNEARLPIFTANYREFADYAKKTKNQKVRMNKYADLTREEYKRLKAGLPVPSTPIIPTQSTPASGKPNLPEIEPMQADTLLGRRKMKTSKREDEAMNKIVNAYKDWCSHYGKTYDEARLPIFTTRYLQVEEHFKNTGHRMKFGKYADMTPEEVEILKNTAKSKAEQMSEEEAKKQIDLLDREEIRLRARNAEKFQTEKPKLEAEADILAEIQRVAEERAAIEAQLEEARLRDAAEQRQKLENEAARRQQEAAAREKAEEEERMRAAAEEEAWRKAEEQARINAAGMRARLKAEELAAKLKLEEEAIRQERDARTVQETRNGFFPFGGPQKTSFVPDKKNFETSGSSRGVNDSALGNETFDTSIPYDAPAKLAYENSDKLMSFPDFKAKFESAAIADVIAKQAARKPMNSKQQKAMNFNLEDAVKKRAAENASMATYLGGLSGKKLQANPQNAAPTFQRAGTTQTPQKITPNFQGGANTPQRLTPDFQTATSISQGVQSMPQGTVQTPQKITPNFQGQAANPQGVSPSFQAANPQGVSPSFPAANPQGVSPSFQAANPQGVSPSFQAATPLPQGIPRTFQPASTSQGTPSNFQVAATPMPQGTIKNTSKATPNFQGTAAPFQGAAKNFQGTPAPQGTPSMPQTPLSSSQGGTPAPQGTRNFQPETQKFQGQQTTPQGTPGFQAATPIQGMTPSSSQGSTAQGTTTSFRSTTTSNVTYSPPGMSSLNNPPRENKFQSSNDMNKESQSMPGASSTRSPESFGSESKASRLSSPNTTGVVPQSPYLNAVAKKWVDRTEYLEALKKKANESDISNANESSQAARKSSVENSSSSSRSVEAITDKKDLSVKQQNATKNMPGSKAKKAPSKSIFDSLSNFMKVGNKKRSEESEDDDKGRDDTRGVRTDVPVISDWVQNDDGSITGFVNGSSTFPDGTRITTSEVRRGVKKGSYIWTNSGSQYRLD